MIAVHLPALEVGAAADCGGAVCALPAWHGRLADCAGGQLAGARRGGVAGRPCARGRRDLVRARRLAGADRHRIPRRSDQRLHAVGGGRRRRGDHPVRARQHCRRDPGRPAGLVLHHVPACAVGPARRRHHRRRLQHLRVSGDLVAGELRDDRHGARPPGADGGLPVFDHGHDRRHFHRHRRRAVVGDDRHAQPARSEPADPGHRRTAPGAGGTGVPDRRDLAETGAVPAASVAAQRVRLCAVGR